jgi:hypothetical protein
MNTMELTINQDSYIKTIIKWTCLTILLSLCAFGTNTLHQNQLQKLMANADLFSQKTFLISQMHKEMLLISRKQLQILHASSEQEAREILWSLSELVSDHLIHYHQLKNLADEPDIELLNQFKKGFNRWRAFNKNLLDYANVVSDSGFINTLNKVDMAFSQFDSDATETLLLITKLE